MSVLTRDNVRYLCRTCLVQAENMSLIHTKVQSLLSKMEIWTGAPRLGSEIQTELLPQSICTSCLDTMESFDTFCRRARDSAEKLMHLFQEKVSAEMKTEEKSDDVGYELLLNETLMETESVILDHMTAAYGGNHDPIGSVVAAEVKCEDHSDELDETHEESPDEHKVDVAEDSNKTVIKGSIKEQTRNPSLRILRGQSTASSISLKRKKVADKRKVGRPKGSKKKCREEEQLSEDDDVKSKQPAKASGKNSHKCKQCTRCFAHKMTLDAHVRRVHEGDCKRPFKCDRCDKEYTFFGGLHTHIKEIHEALVRSYPCDFVGCDRVYTSHIAMKKHRRTNHSEHFEKKFVCEICGATFGQSANLKYHHRKKHSPDAPAPKKDTDEIFECSICQKTFTSRYTLKYHTLQQHVKDMRYECNVCGRRMAKKFMLVQHMHVHSTEKIPCEHCGKRFIRKCELEAHVRVVHMKVKPYECQYCHESFACRKTLIHHEYIHTGEKPYVCDICGTAYRQRSCLKNHRKTHERNRGTTEQHATALVNNPIEQQEKPEVLHENA